MNEEQMQRLLGLAHRGAVQKHAAAASETIALLEVNAYIFLRSGLFLLQTANGSVQLCYSKFSVHE